MSKPKGSVRQCECWVHYNPKTDTVWEGIFFSRNAARRCLRAVHGTGEVIRRARLIVDMESKG